MGSIKEKVKKNKFLYTVKKEIDIAKYKMNSLLVSDEKFIKKRYKEVFNKEINLESPKTFNEKLQWQKMNASNELYSKLVDKYEVREYVREKIGEEYLNELYDVYNSVEEIDLDKLPNQFVMKTTHDSGGVIVCKNKDDIGWDYELLKFKMRLKLNYYYTLREPYYKFVKPKIICERLLVDKIHGTPLDYKIFCFNGKPTYIQVDCDRFENHKRNIYDTDWNLLELRIIYENTNYKIKKPKNLEEMLRCATKLSKGINFCRVDFYSINEKIIFGEITFFPEGGFGKIIPEKYDRLLGDMLK